MPKAKHTSQSELTFKGNRGLGRHGWLRLTPAYSVRLVEQILESGAVPEGPVLDPFCGSGTTALVCAERGLRADTTDINGFLLWLAAAKSRNYSLAERRAFRLGAASVERALGRARGSSAWVPPLYKLEKWWSEATLAGLSRGLARVERLNEELPGHAADLLKVAFCRTLIARAHVSFGHQSMSFRRAEAAGDELEALKTAWREAVALISAGAEQRLAALPRAVLCDARELERRLSPGAYRAVITSPPYPNRMSYVRELRPYMYWLRYLDSGKSAGELDWQAIGGTWGRATSNLTRWQPDASRKIPFRGFERRILPAIRRESPVLASYVHKYFEDMLRHCESLQRLLVPGATVHYIVGNSKFYDVLLPVERIFAALFAATGFRDTEVRTIRKRSSKKELFEFVVSAEKA